MTPTYEITQLLYEVLDRLERIEKTLEIESVELDGGVGYDNREQIVGRISPKLRLITDEEN